MSLVCKTCGNKIEDSQLQRCPRCYTILKEPPKCGDCKGCSIGLKNCNK
ncbi:hypothetical protein [Anaerosolibacter sp.]|nr:hypothetical protein [Anaerosolibacter sp.]